MSRAHIREFEEAASAARRADDFTPHFRDRTGPATLLDGGVDVRDYFGNKP